MLGGSGRSPLRGPRVRITGPELDDLACQAAADALMAITGKLGQFRGESRFTTWACKFAIFEVSSKIGRHFWQRPTVAMDGEDWDRLPDRFGLVPADAAEWREVVAGLRRAVDEELTGRRTRQFKQRVVPGQWRKARLFQILLDATQHPALDPHQANPGGGRFRRWFAFHGRGSQYPRLL